MPGKRIDRKAAPANGSVMPLALISSCAYPISKPPDRATLTKAVVIRKNRRAAIAPMSTDDSGDGNGTFSLIYLLALRAVSLRCIGGCVAVIYVHATLRCIA